ncbi:MAG: carboxypeptidase regulatory-like domain-containing protein [Thermoanaerobaculia bacterium]
MKSAYRFSLALSVCLLLLAPVAVFAQTTGTVDGTVTDQSGAPLPGVTVELTGPNLQGMRTAVTSADGRYRFPSVPPGPYKVTATLSGFGRVQKNATVTLDSTASVALQLSLSTTAEITVTGEAPLVDVTSTTQGSNYSAAIMSKLPIGRNYAQIVFTQPGVQADFGETQGRSLAISIYGATSAENLFIIDGVNTTNVIKGFQGKDINTEFIQEVEVKTGGYQAEYGRNTGGVINVVTKSGGNEFHGGVFGYYNDTGMRADLLNADPANYDTPEFSETGDAQFLNNALSKDNRTEWGADLGGFVWKDKIWFFGAYNRVKVDQNVQTLDVQNTTTFGHEFPISFFQNKYSGKLTFNLLQGTSLVGTIFSDAQVQEGAINVPTSLNPITYSGRRDTGGPDYGARLNQLFGSFGILTLQYSQHKDRFTTNPFQVDLPQLLDYTGSATGSTFVRRDGFGSVFGPTINNSSKREAYAGSFTGYVGNHEIKVGGDYQNDNTFGISYFTGNVRNRVRPCLQAGANICDLDLAPFYTNPTTGEVRQVFYEHDTYVDSAELGSAILDGAPFETPTKRWSAFFQDQWRIMPTLTFNVGIRYDAEDIQNNNLETAFKLEDEWAPRVGLVWDFVGDGTSKLYASAGRFYYALPTDLNVRVFSSNTQQQTWNYSPTDLNQLGAPGSAGGGTGSGTAPRNRSVQGGSATGEPIDGWELNEAGTGNVLSGAPRVKAAYQDELTVGIEKALDPTLSIGLKGTYRTLGRTVEDRCDLDYNDPLSQGSTCALFNPGSDGVAASGGILSYNGCGNPNDPGCGTIGNPGVPVGDAKRIFRGIEMTARKQFSNQLWAQASFLYSSLKGNYSGAIREASGQTDPGINADFDYYQFNFNAYGRLELDRPVQARLDAVYTAPFGLTVGGGFYVRSGLPISRLGWFNTFYPDLLYLDQRGELARTPTDYDLNMSLGYNINVGPVTITPQAYLFNIINKQFPVSYQTVYNTNGSFDGLEPVLDEPDYLKVNQRNNPRTLRVALKVTF